MDHSFDPCAGLQNLDFNNSDHLEQILKRDKHTRIEGICTEDLFLKQLVVGRFSDYSVGWWFTLKAGTYTVIKLDHTLDKITYTDLKILDFFDQNGLSTFVVGYDETKRNFYYIDYAKLSTNGRVREWYRERMPFPKKQRAAPPMPKKSERRQDRLDKAVALLRSWGGLKNAAIERVFANCWLHNLYWDIDCFVLLGDRILALEVKQKYPTARNTFGLNVGLAKLFTFLASLGLSVYHIILTKPTRDYRIPAVDFYAKNRYKTKLAWLGIEFSPEILSKNTSIAPSRTSIYSSSPLRYYHLQPDDFHLIKKLNEADNRILEFLAGKTKPIAQTHGSLGLL